MYKNKDMFIEYLNKEEKEVFFSLALDLVKVDDAFSLDEKEKAKKGMMQNIYIMICLHLKIFQRRK